MPARGPMSNLHLDILKGTDEYLEPSDLFVQGMFKSQTNQISTSFEKILDKEMLIYMWKYHLQTHKLYHLIFIVKWNAN